MLLSGWLALSRAVEVSLGLAWEGGGWLLLWASLLGETIVGLFASACYLLARALADLALGIGILTEDFFFFLLDLGTCFFTAVHLCLAALHALADTCAALLLHLAGILAKGRLAGRGAAEILRLTGGLALKTAHLMRDTLVFAGCGFFELATFLPSIPIYIVYWLGKLIIGVGIGIFQGLKSVAVFALLGLVTCMKETVAFFYNTPPGTYIGLTLFGLCIAAICRLQRRNLINGFCIPMVVRLVIQVMGSVCSIWRVCRKKVWCSKEDGERKEECVVADEVLCVICQDKRRNVILLPCRHFCICFNCLRAVHPLRFCPVCRQVVINVIDNVYM